jgi:ribosomal protein S18 acetylase RimI-like enzyme
MTNIRKSDIDDALIISQINFDAWNHAYKDIIPPEILEERKIDQNKINNWKQNITNKDYTVIVGEKDSVVCGYLWAGQKRNDVDDIPYEIYSIYVDPNQQRKGIGKALINEYKRIIHNEPFYLYMLKGNAPASSFYKKNGGVENPIYDRTISMNGYEIEEVMYTFKNYK